MIPDVLFQGSECSHHDSEHYVVHRIAAGVGGEVFFYSLFYTPPDASGQAGKHCRINKSFNKLVVRLGCIYYVTNYSA